MLKQRKSFCREFILCDLQMNEMTNFIVLILSIAKHERDTSDL